MKPNLAVVAIVLGIIAIMISIMQPLYSFLATTNINEEGTPSFNIYRNDFYVFYTFTRIVIHNNGTATAHNIKVNLIFHAPALQNWEATEFIPELKKDEYVNNVEIPIGIFQLNSTVPHGPWFTNVTSYEAYVHITCKELISTTSFHFTNVIT